MNLTKKDIAKKISREIEVPIEISSSFITSFFNIQKKALKSNTLKISKFGSYKIKISPERVGRNPKTLKKYIISKKKRVSFKASNFIKKS